MSEPQRIARIYYQWWGNAHPENRMWQLISPDNELKDYGTKEQLIAEAEKQGWTYQVERWHRDGSMSIMKTNKPS
jgi:hypothetical protein